MCNIGRLKFDAVPLVLYALLRRGYRYYQLGSSNDVNLRYPILLTVMSILGIPAANIYARSLHQISQIVSLVWTNLLNLLSWASL
jgi:hypothetical protein